jgi:hypothetical protein
VSRRPALSVTSGSEGSLACALLRPALKQQEKEAPMDAFKCQQCGKTFGNQEELRKHEQACIPTRVK